MGLNILTVKSESCVSPFLKAAALLRDFCVFLVMWNAVEFCTSWKILIFSRL